MILYLYYHTKIHGKKIISGINIKYKYQYLIIRKFEGTKIKNKKIKGNYPHNIPLVPCQTLFIYRKDYNFYFFMDFPNRLTLIN